MTIMIIGYVVTVALAVYFVNKFARSAREFELRLRNVKRWLDEANEDQFVKADALRAAYNTIDRYELILREEYNHFKEDQSLPEDPVADEVCEAIFNDNIACAGIYYDEEGNPMLDQLDWTPQDGVTYSDSDDSDV